MYENFLTSFFSHFQYCFKNMVVLYLCFETHNFVWNKYYFYVECGFSKIVNVKLAKSDREIWVHRDFDHREKRVHVERSQKPEKNQPKQVQSFITRKFLKRKIRN